MSFSSRLKERRESLNMSRGELASKLGVTPAAIGNYENGISSPKEEILYKIFSVLNVEPNYLWQDEMNSDNQSFSISYPERNIIENYRILDKHGKEIVKMVICKELERCINKESSPISEESETRGAYKISDVEYQLFHDFLVSRGFGEDDELTFAQSKALTGIIDVINCIFPIGEFDDLTMIG